MSNVVLRKPFADLVFEGRNKSFGAYFLRRIYEKNILLAVVASIVAFSIALASPVIYGTIFPEEKKEVVMENVEVTLEEIESISPEEEMPLPPPPVENIEPPKINKVKFLPPVVKPDPEVKVEEVPPSQEELEDANPGDVTQEGTSLNELVEVETKVAKVVEEEPEEDIYTWVQEKAEFPGGNDELKKFLGSNLTYPQEALEKQISDFVVVEFIIDQEGLISDIDIKKSAGYGMDEEAIRVVKSMPKWAPAHQNGKPVKFKKQIKIPFILK